MTVTAFDHPFEDGLQLMAFCLQGAIMAIDRDTDKNDLMPDDWLDDRAYSQFLRERSAMLRARAEAFRQIAREILKRSRTIRERHRSD
jgi:hypothetical protein